MSILVIADHDNNTVLSSTLNTVTAAQKIGSDVVVLVAGQNVQGAADAAEDLATV